MSNPNEAMETDKRASEVFAGQVAAGSKGLEISSPPAIAMPVKEDVIVRMTRELQAALQKPAAERRWIMVIDLRKCVGCSACTVACIAENKLPPGVVYRPVLVEEVGTYPNTTMKFLPRPCLQCEEPPCTDVCPVNATYRTAEGIVVIDYNQCIGCRACIAACPYGARSFDFGQSYTQNTPDQVDFMLGQSNANGYERLASFEYGDQWPRNGQNSPVGNVRKCHFCLQRVNQGMVPACTATCIGRATYFGDSNDPNSLVSELISGTNVMRLKEDLGTKPRVYYLV